MRDEDHPRSSAVNRFLCRIFFSEKIVGRRQPHGALTPPEKSGILNSKGRTPGFKSREDIYE